MDRANASSAAGDAVEVALLAVVAPDRVALAPPALLPSGAIHLIRVAAEDRALAMELADRHGVDLRAIEDAALHFVHSVMFHPDSDFFRVLGVRPEDDEDTLKLHFRWLQKWLHPDRDPEGWVSVYAERVNVAWSQLRRADRRAEYRRALAVQMAAPQVGGFQLPLVAGRGPEFLAATERLPLFSSRWARRLPVILVGSVIVLAVGVFAAHRAGESLIAEQRSRTSVADTTDDAADQRSSGIVSAAEESPGSGLVMAQSARTHAPIPAIPPPLPAERSAPSQAGVAAERAPTAGSVSRPAKVAPGSGLAAASRDPGPAAENQQAASGAALGERPVMLTTAPVLVDRAKPLETGSALPKAIASDTATPPPSAGRDAVAGEGLPRRVGLAGQTPQEPPRDPDPTESSRTRGDLIAVALTAVSAVETADASASSVGTPAASPTGRLPDTAAPSVPSAEVRAVIDPQQARRLLNDFSGAYRNGELQRLIVLFAPNASTPAGNLLDLHQRYKVLFGGSNRRSLEFVDLAWRPLPHGLEATGRFEWARHQPGRAEVESASGPVRVVIQIVDERLLITVLEHPDVG